MYHTTLAKDEFVRVEPELRQEHPATAALWPVATGAVIRRLNAQFGNRPFRVLDVGCGTGVFAERMRTALPNAEVWGVDLVSAMLDSCQGRPALAYAAHPRGGLCRFRAIPSGFRSRPHRLTSSRVATASTITRIKIAPWPRCGVCWFRAAS